MAQQKQDKSNESNEEIDLLKSLMACTTGNGFITITVDLDIIDSKIHLIYEEASKKLVSVEIFDAENNKIGIPKEIIPNDYKNLVKVMANKNNRNYNKIFDLIRACLSVEEKQLFEDQIAQAVQGQFDFNQLSRRMQANARTWQEQMKYTAHSARYLPILFSDYEKIATGWTNEIIKKDNNSSIKKRLKDLHFNTITMVKDSEKDNESFLSDQNRGKKNKESPKERTKLTGKKRVNRDFEDDNKDDYMPMAKRHKRGGKSVKSVKKSEEILDEKEREGEISDGGDENEGSIARQKKVKGAVKNGNKNKNKNKNNNENENENEFSEENSQKSEKNKPSSIGGTTMNNSDNKNVNIINFTSPVKSDSIVSYNNNNGNDKAQE